MGYSPKDDCVFFEYIMKYSLPLLDDCLMYFFKFNIYKSLLLEYSSMLDKGKRVYEHYNVKKDNNTDIQPGYWFKPLAQLIKHNTRHNYMPHWELKLTEDDDAQYIINSERKTDIEKHFNWNYHYLIVQYAMNINLLVVN